MEVSTLSNCLPDFTFEAFTHYCSIPAALIILLLAFLERRRSRRHLCDGRPALIVPIHFLDGYEDRFGYAAAFGAITNLIIRLFITVNIYSFQYPMWATAIFIQLRALEYSVVCFPLFACIATRHRLVGAIVLFLYSTLWFIGTVVDAFKIVCASSGANKGIKAQIIVSQVPVFVCYAYLMLRSVYSIYTCVRKQKYVLEENADVIHPHQALYVRVMFHVKNNHSMNTQEEKKWYHKLYKPVHGFKYPVRIVATVFIIISIFFQILVFLLWFGFQAIYFVAKNDNSAIFNQAYLNGTLTVLTPTAVNIFIGVYFLGVLLVFVMAFVNIYLLVTNYKSDILQMFRGVSKFTIDKTKPTHFIMAENLRFPGYQVAYMLWGMIILLMVVLVLGVVISYVIFFLAVNHLMLVALSQLAQLLSVPATMLILFYLQVIVARFVLLQPKVKDTDKFPPLNVDNRRFYEDFNYYAFFGNLGIGMVACFFRIIQGTVLGVFFVGRLERTIFMAGWEFRDKGYQAYIGMLRMDNAHNNPILRVFSGILWEVAFKKRHLEHLAAKEDRGVSRKYRRFPTIERPAPSSQSLPSVVNFDSNDCDSEYSFENIPVSRNNIHRRRWWVAYTLIHNPDLCQKRKRSLFEIETVECETGARDLSLRRNEVSI